MNVSVQIIETKTTPSYDINVHIYLFDTPFNTSGLANKSPCRPQPQQLQLGPHAGCYQTHTHPTLSVQVFNLHFSICTGVQPTLICTGVQSTLHYLYRCSTYTYLYTCSTYTSLYVHVFYLNFSIVHVFNLHVSICTRVQPTLLPTAVSTSFTAKREKPKELSKLEQLKFPFLGDQSIDFAVMVNVVGLTSCI